MITVSMTRQQAEEIAETLPASLANIFWAALGEELDAE